MDTRSMGAKRRWLASGGVALIVGGLVLLLFRAPAPAASAMATLDAPKPAFHVKLVPEDEMAIRDLTPLFLPTKYNAAPTLSPSLNPGTQRFDTDAQRIGSERPALKRPALAEPPADAMEALRDSPGSIAYGIGRADTGVAPRKPTGGHIDVFAGDRTDSILALDLPVEARPTSVTGEVYEWQPLEFVAAVNTLGQVGSLVLRKGSGVEQVDGHFRNYLAQTFRLGDRLPPGVYRIVVGP